VVTTSRRRKATGPLHLPSVVQHVYFVTHARVGSRMLRRRRNKFCRGKKGGGEGRGEGRGRYKKGSLEVKRNKVKKNKCFYRPFDYFDGALNHLHSYRSSVCPLSHKKNRKVKPVLKQNHTFSKRCMIRSRINRAALTCSFLPIFFSFSAINLLPLCPYQ